MFPLAVEIPIEAIVTTGTVLAGLVVGVAKFIFEHRDLKHKAKGEAAKQLTYRELLDLKDKRIGELTDALSQAKDDLAQAKDAYAAKIQELSEITIEKIEGMGDRNIALLERMLTAIGELTAEIRKLRGQHFPSDSKGG